MGKSRMRTLTVEVVVDLSQLRCAMSGIVPGEGRTGAVRAVFRPGSVPV